MSVISLLHELKTEKEKYERSVTQNGVRDFAQYKFLVGQIAGFETAIEICRNIFKGEIND
jgi:hypothetical protein